MGIVPAFMCVDHHVCVCLVPKKGLSDPLEFKLHIIMTCHAGSGNQIKVLIKSSQSY